jgi:hypothetical protein
MRDGDGYFHHSLVDLFKLGFLRLRFWGSGCVCGAWRVAGAVMDAYVMKAAIEID